MAMIRSWMNGESPVQSRLVVDVRDCAQAHINAATTPHAAGKRYIVSCEARVAAEECAAALAAGLRQCGREEDAMRLTADTAFDGGAIPIGQQEVVAIDGLAELSVACRSTAETLSDTVEAIVSPRPRDALA